MMTVVWLASLDPYHITLGILPYQHIMLCGFLSSSFSNSALHFAAWQNRSEIVEILLVNGAQVGTIMVECKGNKSSQLRSLATHLLSPSFLPPYLPHFPSPFFLAHVQSKGQPRQPRW